MVLIQLLLPTALPNAEPTEAMAALAVTHSELAERFAGLTAYVRSPARGVWTAPDGRTEHDDVAMVEVVTEHFDRDWWSSYVARLAERFRQQTMHVRALPIELLHQRDDNAPDSH